MLFVRCLLNSTKIKTLVLSGKDFGICDNIPKSSIIGSKIKAYSKIEDSNFIIRLNELGMIEFYLVFNNGDSHLYKNVNRIIN